ncbi:MAG: MFS transporter, partial [Eggerthellaceae bacterium]|nr:MFS transporter [Eggerthellaceae bacterium]
MASVKKGPLVLALMTVIFLAAMESTITVLATPIITRDLSGFELMSFVFSAYLFTCAIITPIFGWLADRHGRKRMLSIGITLFLVGSALCGFSQTMGMLIAFRAIQGLGAGSIFSLTYTIAGDSFPIESRAGILGALGSVWGVAGLLGPVLGGFLIESLSWHWVFFINIPLGVPCLLLLNYSLKEPKRSPEQLKARSSWVGLVTKTTIFINVVALLTCVIMQGIDVYLTLYLQNVLGYSAMVTGLAFLPMTFSWLAVSYLTGKLLVRISGKKLILVAGLWQILCSFLCLTLNVNTSLPLVVLYIFLIGFGMGGLMTSTTVIIQESVGYSQRGRAMGINSFIKTMGQTLGVTVYGVILNASLGKYFEGIGLPGINSGNLYGSESAALVDD